MAKDTLSITDNRTGQTYEVPVTLGTIKAMDLRPLKVSPGDEVRLIVAADDDRGEFAPQTGRSEPVIFSVTDQAGILESLLDRLAVYMEKTEAIKSKIKSALMYPIAVVVVMFR